MKIIYNLLVLLIISTFISCDDREIEFTSSFPFEVKADFEKNTFINTPINAIFDIIPEYIVTTNVYSFSYIVLEGEASLGSPTAKKTFFEREVYVVEDMRLKASITPKTKGKTNIEFTFFDQEGETTIKTIEIDSKDTNFIVNTTGSLSNINIGERLQISYQIEEQGTIDIDKYSLVFSSSKNGYLTVNNKDYLAGEEIQIPNLSFVAFYTPTTDGEHIITSKITANSNRLVQSSDVNVTVEPSNFEFTISSSNEITVGETTEIDFNINELVGDSNFDISYSLTGVKAELKDANNVVLIPGQKYDVDNTFKLSLKGIEQGTTEITFNIENQFGVQKTKKITIQILPIDFDFNVELLDNILTLERGIRLRFNMNAPNVLDYDLSFNANTGGRIRVGVEDINKGETLPVGNTTFDAIYYASLSGNTVLNFTITASNGVTKTKSMNFDITQRPKVTGVFDYSAPCGMVTVPRQRFRIVWTKDDREAIVSAEIRLIGNGTNITRRKTFNPPITGGTNFDQEFYTGCTNPPDRIEIKIIDSRGQQSETFKKNYKE